jgi:hypothetical protein
MNCCPGEELETPPPGPFANTLEADATSRPTTAAHDKILFIGNLSPKLIGSVPRLPMQLTSYSDSFKNRLPSKLVIDELFSPHALVLVLQLSTAYPQPAETHHDRIMNPTAAGVLGCVRGPPAAVPQSPPSFARQHNAT